MSRTNKHSQWIQRLAVAGLVGDAPRLHSTITSAIKSLRQDDPELSKELAQLLSQHATNPSYLRSTTLGPPPTDSEEGLALVRRHASEGAEPPVLPDFTAEMIRQFVRERHHSHRLFSEGFSPTGSVLLIGPPGTGKSMLARWLAQELGLPFIVQDLATSISSLLGKTGLNIRRTLDYARRHPCVLLLDEFDAIAKRRDDQSELGELKRIVNVLLKELEEWPEHSVLIAATNHPALLDPAIARRFQLVLNLELPGEDERLQILLRAAGKFGSAVDDSFLKICAELLVNRSGSDITTVMTSAVRRHLLTERSLEECLVELLLPSIRRKRLSGPKIGVILRGLQGSTGTKKMTVRELAALVGKTPSTVQHHLTKGRSHG